MGANHLRLPYGHHMHVLQVARGRCLLADPRRLLRSACLPDHTKNNRSNDEKQLQPVGFCQGTRDICLILKFKSYTWFNGTDWLCRLHPTSAAHEPNLAVAATRLPAFSILKHLFTFLIQTPRYFSSSSMYCSVFCCKADL